MANNKVIVNFDFKANIHDVQSNLSKLKTSLQQIIGQAGQVNIGGHINTQLQSAIGAAQSLQKHLTAAFNSDTGTLDLTKFNASLRSSGQNVTMLGKQLLGAGAEGKSAFMGLATSLVQAEIPAVKLSTTMGKLMTTFANNARWMLSSSVLTGFISGIREAVDYTKDLNESLTDIRIVTGKSAEEMDRLAKSANKMAKELKTSTAEVVKGQLIYYQQGDNAALAAKKAEITTKAANVSFGTSQEQMSEYLTAIWNSYQVGEDQLEQFVDVLAAVGATTATSMEEIATAMQKVAATGNAVGVSYEQLTATIATISSITRTSSEQVGTALKTIYARIGDLKAGGLDEDDIGLGQVSSGLQKVGVEILDAQNNIRDMGEVVEEIGGKWNTWTEAQQQAIVQLIAGKRQYTQMMALFENWDMYESTLATAEGADGELNKQQEIWAQSWEAASNNVKATLESMYTQIFDDDVFIGLLNGVNLFLNGIDKISDLFGGLSNTILIISALLVQHFSIPLADGLRNAALQAKTLFDFTHNGYQVSQSEVSKMLGELKTVTAEEQGAVGILQQKIELQVEYASLMGNLTQKQKEEYSNNMQTLEVLQKMHLERLKNVDAAHKEAMATTEVGKQNFKNIISSKQQAQNHVVNNMQQNAIDRFATNKNGIVNPNAKSQIEQIFNEFKKGEIVISQVKEKMKSLFGAKDVNEFFFKNKNSTSRYNELQAEINETIGSMQQLKQINLDGNQFNKMSVDEAALAYGQLQGSVQYYQEALSSMGANAGQAMAQQQNLNTVLNAAELAFGKDSAEVKEFAAILKSGNLDVNQFKNILDAVQKQLQGETLSKATADFNKIRAILKSAGVDLDEFNAGVDEIAASAKDATGTLDSMSNTGKKTKEDLNAPQKKGWADWTMSISSAMMSIMSVVNAVTSAIDTIKSPDSTGWEKFSAVMSVVTTAGMSVAMIWPVLSDIIAAGNLKMGITAETAGWQAVKMWLQMLGPYLLVVAAIGLVVAGLVLLVKHVNAAEDNAKRAAEALEQARNGAAEASKAYAELKDGIADYKEAQNGLDALREGTDSFKTAVIEANQKVLELIEKYPELQKFMEIDSNGRMTISIEGFEEALKQQEGAVLNSSMRLNNARANSLRANQRLELEDYMKIDYSEKFFSDYAAGFAGGPLYDVITKGEYDWRSFFPGLEFAQDIDANRQIDDIIDKFETTFTSPESLTKWDDIDALAEELGTNSEYLNANKEELMALSQQVINNTNEISQLNKTLVQERNKQKFDDLKLSEQERNYLSTTKSKDKLTDEQINTYVNNHYKDWWMNHDKNINKDWTDMMKAQTGKEYRVVDGNGGDEVKVEYKDANGGWVALDGKFLQSEMRVEAAKYKLSEITDEDVKQMEEQKKSARDKLMHSKSGKEQDLSQAKSISENDLKDFEQLYLQFLSGEDMDLSSFTQEELSEMEKLIDNSQLDDKFKKQFKLEKKDYQDDVFGAQAAGARQFSQALEKAGKAIEKIKNATKEIDDDGFLSYSTIEEIGKGLEEMGISAGEWKEKLYVANGSAQETKEVLGQIGIAIAQNTASAQDWSLAIDGNTIANQKLVDSTEAQITAQLRELGITNASQIAHEQVTAAMANEMLIRGENIDEIEDFITGENAATDATYSLVAAEQLLALESGKIDFTTFINNLSGLIDNLDTTTTAGLSTLAMIKTLQQYADLLEFKDGVFTVKSSFNNGHSYTDKEGNKKFYTWDDKEEYLTKHGYSKGIVDGKIRTGTGEIVTNVGAVFDTLISNEGYSKTGWLTEDTIVDDAMKTWQDLQKQLAGGQGVFKTHRGTTTNSGGSTGGGGDNEPEWLKKYNREKDRLQHMVEMGEMTQREMNEELNNLWYTLKLDIPESDYAEDKYLSDINSIEEEVFNMNKENLEQNIENLDKALEQQEISIENYSKQFLSNIDTIYFTLEEKKERIDKMLDNMLSHITDVFDQTEKEWERKEFDRGIIDYNMKAFDYEATLRTLYDMLLIAKQEGKSWVEQLKIIEEIYKVRQQIRDLNKEQYDLDDKIAEDYMERGDFKGYENGDNRLKAESRELAELINLGKDYELVLSLFGTQEEYNLEVSKKRLEYQKSIRDAIKETLELEKELKVARLESQKTLLNGEYDISNQLREARKNINDQLQESLTMYQYLDKSTRKLLFNEEDYLELSKALNKIETESLALQERYRKKIANAKTQEDLEFITAEYERQNELLMKRYEIAEKELGIVKARTELENTLKERNTQMFINGRWQWVADQKAIIEAQKKLNDAEFDKETSELENEKLLEEQKLDTKIDQINLQWEKAVKDLEGKTLSLSEIMDSFNGTIDEGTKKFAKALGLDIEEGEYEVPDDQGNGIEFAHTGKMSDENLKLMNEVVYWKGIHNKENNAWSWGELSKAYDNLSDAGYKDLVQQLKKSTYYEASVLYGQEKMRAGYKNDDKFVKLYSEQNELTGSMKNLSEQELSYTQQLVNDFAFMLDNPTAFSKEEIKIAKENASRQLDKIGATNAALKILDADAVETHDLLDNIIDAIQNIRIGSTGSRPATGYVDPSSKNADYMRRYLAGDSNVMVTHNSIQEKDVNGNWRVVSTLAKGSLNALAGLTQINEIGEETFVTPDGHFRNFAGGEVVFTHEQSQRLFSLLNADLFDINKMPRVGNFEQSNSNDTYISIGGISIDTTTQDGKDLVEILQRITNI